MAKPTGIGNDIISLREAGRTYKQIQKELGCSKSTIHYHCKKRNLTDIGFKRVQVNDTIANEIYEFCKIKGNTAVKASEKFDLSLSTIKKYKKGGFTNETDINEESHDE